MDLSSLVESLATSGELVHLARLPARPARHAEPAAPLAPELAARVPGAGLWSHQAEALDHLRAGRHVVVATGTASGKSLCYQLAVAEAAAKGRTSLLLFPTKALARDQLRALGRLDLPGVVPAAYDGDTDPDIRTWARRHANVVITNPDMLHAGVLPHHGGWAPFLSRLSLVVADELHVLRGVFGTHVAHLLRRLRRLGAHYGADPQLVFCSATIGEPDRLAADLCGSPVAAVTEDGSPRAERVVALWNPVPPPDRPGDRPSPTGDAARVTSELVEEGHRTIAFCASRRGVEVLAQAVARRLPIELSSTVRPYRGGYLADERREIERALTEGRLGAVVATSALELGVDIGGLDACVLAGFPGTIASFWQRAGRAGRRTDESLVVLVAGHDQLDQWLVGHPRQLLERPPEPAVINTANRFVADAHLACAAHELPLDPATDRIWWPAILDDAVLELTRREVLVVRNGRATWTGRGSPAHQVGLRSGGATEVLIAEADGTLVGTVDGARAFATVHPGAVYLHQGTAWRVTDLDLHESTAWVERHSDTYTTRPRHHTDLQVLEVLDQARIGGARMCLGRVEVCEQVVGYERLDPLTGEVLHREPLDLPPSALATQAVWWEMPPALVAGAGIPPHEVDGALHAVEHAAIGMLPLLVICDRWDVGGISTAALPESGWPGFVIYDGYPGGAGIAEMGFTAGAGHLAATLEVVASCPCWAGCPSCVQSPKCGNGNDPLSKQGAVALLEAVLRGPGGPAG